MIIKDLETGEHLIKDGNVCAVTYIKDRDEKDDLSKGEYIVKDNKLYQATPLIKLKDCIEKKKNVRQDYKKKIIMGFGNAIEYLTKNNYQIHFFDKDKKDICIIKKFDGNFMKGKQSIIKLKSGNKISYGKYKKYIPSGYFVLNFKISKINRITGYHVNLIPADTNPIKVIKNGPTNFYCGMHPHQHGGPTGSFCSGTNIGHYDFNIDNIITKIESTLYGNSDGKNDLFHYNPVSPCTQLKDCHYGKVAYDLHKQGLTDLEIIKQIRIKRGEI